MHVFSPHPEVHSENSNNEKRCSASTDCRIGCAGHKSVKPVRCDDFLLFVSFVGPNSTDGVFQRFLKKATKAFFYFLLHLFTVSFTLQAAQNLLRAELQSARTDIHDERWQKEELQFLIVIAIYIYIDEMGLVVGPLLVDLFMSLVQDVVCSLPPCGCIRLK